MLCSKFLSTKSLRSKSLPPRSILRFIDPMPKINRPFANPVATENAFYDALARGDLDLLMTLWADEDEIVCIHPGAPRLIGNAAIRASWEAIFERGGVHITPVDRHETHTTMTAIHNVIEQITSDDPAQEDRHVLATNVYVKTPLGWRIVIHHASIAPGAAPIDTSASTLH